MCSIFGRKDRDGRRERPVPRVTPDEIVTRQICIKATRQTSPLSIGFHGAKQACPSATQGKATTKEDKNSGSRCMKVGRGGSGKTRCKYLKKREQEFFFHRVLLKPLSLPPFLFCFRSLLFCAASRASERIWSDGKLRKARAGMVRSRHTAVLRASASARMRSRMVEGREARGKGEICLSRVEPRSKKKTVIALAKSLFTRVEKGPSI